MRRTREFFKNYRWSFLSALLLGTSYIPLPPWALVFCWAPLWWDLAINTKTIREAFLKGWWTQFIATLIGFYWISYVAHEFGFLPWPVAIALLLIFAALAYLYIAVSAGVAVFLRDRFGLSTGPTVLLLACFHSLGEAYWPTIFNWNLGWPLFWIGSGWAQWADLIGFLGLSFVVHLINAQVTWVWIHRNLKVARISVLLTLLLVILANFWGHARALKWQGTQTFKASMIQANIGNLEKVYAEQGVGYQMDILERYFRLSRAAIEADPDTDLLVWPETAVPEFLDDHNRQRRYAQMFFSSMRSLNRSLLTGAYSNDTPETRPREDYNALFLFNEKGEPTAPAYHKTHLLVFGEYVPLGNAFPILRKWNPGGEGFGQGTGAETLPWRDLQVGPQICYDSMSPDFSRALARNGADFLVNLTNDSWFGPYSEPEQHLMVTLGRAIEVRRPLLRSTNTGITTVVEATGKIHEQSPKGQEWFHTYTVPYLKDAGLTFYTRFGAFLSLVPLVVVGLVLGIRRRGPSRVE